MTRLELTGSRLRDFGNAVAAYIRVLIVVETLSDWVSTVNRTVAEHIENLEQRRKLLGGYIMEERDRDKRNQLESELRAVESALGHYRLALEIEAQVVPEP